MADTFYREPTNHGDANVYHDYVMAQLRCGGRGGLSLELLNTGGALHLSAGFAGIDDGVTKGTIECTADQALSIAAISVGNWASIEASVSGSAVAWSVADIAGGTDEWTIPAGVKSAYNYAKGGYYLVAGKRLIGIAFKTAGGTLGRIVNCEDGVLGFKRIRLLPLGASLKYTDTRILEIGDWNILAGNTKQVTHGMSLSKIMFVQITIRNDVDDAHYVFSGNVYTLTAVPLSINIINATSVNLNTDIASPIFHTTDFDSTSYNRGWVTIEYET